MDVCSFEEANVQIGSEIGSLGYFFLNLDVREIDKFGRGEIILQKGKEWKEFILIIQNRYSVLDDEYLNVPIQQAVQW